MVGSSAAPLPLARSIRNDAAAAGHARPAARSGRVKSPARRSRKPAFCARERATEGAAAARAEPGPLVGQRGVGHRPAVVEPTEQIGVGHAAVGHEDLVEQRPTRHLAQRADVDAGLVHLDGEVGDAPMLRHVGVGAGEQHAEVGDLRAGRPHLLTVDDPLVAVADRLGLQAGEVGAGARLAEELAPRLLAGDDVGQEPRALLVGAVGDDGRAGEQQPEPRRRVQRAVAG